MCYPFIVGGDGLLFHNLLSGLGKRSFDVTHLGPLQPVEWALSIRDIDDTLKREGLKANWDGNRTSARKIPGERSLQYDLPDYTCRMSDADLFWNELETSCRDEKPCLLITSLDHAKDVISLGKKNRVPVILWVIDADQENEAVLSEEPVPDGVIFDSYFLKNKYEKFCRSPNRVIYPVLDYSGYSLRRREEGYVTIVNPTVEKGKEVFLKLAGKMPGVNFIVLEGWQKLEKKDFSLPNITLLDRTHKLNEVYERTNILLVPSLIEDAFPTVIPLAQVCGIPVIGSDLGGIPEATGPGGIIINDPLNIDLWVEAVNELLHDNAVYDSYSEAALQIAVRYDPPALVDKFIDFAAGLTG
jgi:glycosyltransferase involved in cell wall biosynthesis